MELNLLCIWTLQGMCYLGLGKMWQISGAHTGSGVSPTQRMRRGVREKSNMNGGEEKPMCSAELHGKEGEPGSWRGMARPWDWPDLAGAADPGVGHRHPGVSLGWGGISLPPPSSMSPSCRERGRSRGDRRREMHEEGMCVWGRQARKPWEMWAECLCLARGT